jgi:hypothetical protein
MVRRQQRVGGGAGRRTVRLLLDAFSGHGGCAAAFVGDEERGR